MSSSLLLLRVLERLSVLYHDVISQLGAEDARGRRTGYHRWGCMDQAIGTGTEIQGLGGEDAVTSKAGGMIGWCTHRQTAG